jgi:hypothetical protein
MRALGMLGEPIDIVTLCARFTRPHLKQVGGVSYLASLTEGLPGLLNGRVELHALIVREDFRARSGSARAPR